MQAKCVVSIESNQSKIRICISQAISEIFQSPYLTYRRADSIPVRRAELMLARRAAGHLATCANNNGYSRYGNGFLRVAAIKTNFSRTNKPNYGLLQRNFSIIAYVRRAANQDAAPRQAQATYS